MTFEHIEVETEPVDKDGKFIFPAEIKQRLNLKSGNALLFTLYSNGKCYVKKINKLSYYYIKIKKMLSFIKGR